MKISVITPVYNGEKYLEQTITSVLSSLPMHSEYLIIDDGSNDSTPEIIEKYAKFVRSFRQINCGEAAAVNLGIKKSIGQYVCIVNADDLIMSELLTDSISILDNNQHLVVTYPDWKMIDESGRELKHIKTKNFSRIKLVEFGECIPGPGAVIRKNLISELGLRNPKYKFFGDYEAWLRLCTFGNFERIPKELASWRKHGASLSFRNDISKSQEHIVVIRDFFANFNPPKLSFKRALGSAYYKAAMSCLLNPRIPRHKYLFLSVWNFPKMRSFLAILFILLSPMSVYILRFLKMNLFRNKID